MKTSQNERKTTDVGLLFAIRKTSGADTSLFYTRHRPTYTYSRHRSHVTALNPLKCSGIRWLHLKLFGAIQVSGTYRLVITLSVVTTGSMYLCSAEGGHFEHLLLSCLPDILFATHHNRFFSEPPMPTHNRLFLRATNVWRNATCLQSYEKFVHFTR